MCAFKSGMTSLGRWSSLGSTRSIVRYQRVGVLLRDVAALDFARANSRGSARAAGSRASDQPAVLPGVDEVGARPPGVAGVGVAGDQHRQQPLRLDEVRVVGEVDRVVAGGDADADRVPVAGSSSGGKRRSRSASSARLAGIARRPRCARRRTKSATLAVTAGDRGRLPRAAHLLKSLLRWRRMNWSVGDHRRACRLRRMTVTAGRPRPLLERVDVVHLDRPFRPRSRQRRD